MGGIDRPERGPANGSFSRFPPQRRSFRFRPQTAFAHARLSFPEANLVEVRPPGSEPAKNGEEKGRHLTISGRQLSGGGAGGGNRTLFFSLEACALASKINILGRLCSV